jgi:hypothetical protein
MRIAVIAANGRTGIEFVAAALAAGHSVRAGTRGDSHFDSHPKLVVVPCDATLKGDVQDLLRNQDAVVSFIGHVRGSAPDVQSVAIQKVVAEMEAKGIKRIVSLTGTGVRFPGDHITLVDRLLNWGIFLIDPARVRDGRNHVEILLSSPLEWTVVRVLKLQNTRARLFKLRSYGPSRWIVSRKDVAQAVLQVLDDHRFIRKAPIIGKP